MKLPERTDVGLVLGAAAALVGVYYLSGIAWVFIVGGVALTVYCAFADLKGTP